MCPFMLVQVSTLWKWYVTFGETKRPLSCLSHLMFLKITLVFKGLVTFGTGKHLPPGVNPFRNHHFVYLQRSYKCEFAWKDLGLIILCFGTYSTLLISLWDLFHSFNISLWTYFSLNNHLPPVLYLIFFPKIMGGINPELGGKSPNCFGTDYILNEKWDLFQYFNCALVRL